MEQLLVPQYNKSSNCLDEMLKALIIQHMTELYIRADEIVLDNTRKGE